MHTEFQNRYGRAVLTPVTPVMPLNDIDSSGPEVTDNCINFEQAEQLALISGNRGIQICFASFEKIYVIAHETSNTAAVCSVRIEAFQCEAANACEQLANEAKRMTSEHLHFV